ncbi:MAG: hypothetical protein Q9M91_01995 [Candidatus Dojkabacteria bacterium]|nr:hypothetical protein [Candidatus Dojkabacteria bacterium]MDQ7020596.1 hypothetical protein [Candidatus Dojkabacteria bacterium]
MITIKINYKEIMGYDYKWSEIKLNAIWNEIYNELTDDVKEIFKDIMKYQDVPYEFDIHPNFKIEEERVIPYRFKLKAYFNSKVNTLVENQLNKYVILTDWTN